MENEIIRSERQQIEIDKRNYTLSLLSVCIEKELISPERQTELLSQFNEVFLETARQYAKRASSTIPKAVAEKIYLSLFFQSDVYLQSLDSDRKAAILLLTKPASELTDLGKKLLLRAFEQSKLVYSAARKKRLDVQNEEYASMMDTAFDSFCAGYSARFDALNICCDINYPLLNIHPLDMPERGVMFMLEYYSCIQRENRFCGYFPQVEINRLLCGYGKIYGVPYKELLFNIASVLLGNLLAAALLEKPPLTLSLSLSDKAALEHYCGLITLDCLCEEVVKRFEPYKEIFGENLHAYLGRYIPTFCGELHRHAEINGMGNFLVFYK